MTKKGPGSRAGPVSFRGEAPGAIRPAILGGGARGVFDAARELPHRDDAVSPADAIGGETP